MYVELPKKAHDLTGRQFGRLVALGPVEIRPYSNGATTVVFWLCRCRVCGGEKPIPAGRLRDGQDSCGCLKSSRCRAAATRHGYADKRLRKQDPTYKAWMHIRSRCRNPKDKKFADYGGRGIGVCERWLESFENFLADMGERPGPGYSIDRRDNNKGYEPENCHWATAIQQGNNKRNNRWVTLDGRTQTLAQWARERGLPYSRVTTRLSRLGWSMEEALEFVSKRC